MSENFKQKRNPVIRLVALIRLHIHIVLAALTCDILKPAITIIIGVLGVVLFKMALSHVEVEELLPLIIIMIILALCRGLFGYLGIFLNHVAAYCILATLRKRLFLSMKPLAPGLMVSRRTGDLTSVAMNNIEMMELFFAHTLNPLFVSIIIPLGVIVTLWWIHPMIAGTLLIFLIIFELVPVILIRANSSTANEMRDSLASLNSYLIDSIQGIWETLAFGRVKERILGLNYRVDQFSTYQTRLFKRNALTSTGNVLIFSLGMLSVLWIARNLVHTGNLDPIYIPICIILTAGSFVSIGSVVDISKQLSLTFTGAKRFFEIIDMEPEVKESPHAHVPKLFSPDVSIDKIRFRYDESEEDILKGVSLKISAGKTAALVGMTGAGKTTLIHLLLRFWDPSQGKISISGEDIREYPLENLRDIISVVSQDVFLFDGTIRENILLGKPSASVEEMVRASNIAQIHPFIRTLPDGYDTMIGERGIRLSGGERQRIAIARAILKNAPILIFDEATSNLDTENEYQIKEALKVLSDGKTVLIIAHRLSTVMHADIIFIMNHGLIEESGNHQELIKKNGMYASLCRIMDNV